jgi:peptidoglycan/LPS O-acetylase OafA/YrhL
LGFDLLLAVAFNTASHGLDAPMYPGIFRFLPFPIIHLPEFVAGALMGNLFLHNVGRRYSGTWTYAAVGFSVAALLLPTGPWTSVAVIGFSALIYSLANSQTWFSRLLSKRLLVFGGGISYAMYLLQSPVRNWVRPFITYSRIPWQLAIVPIILIILSAFVYAFFEDPARKALRTLLRRIYLNGRLLTRFTPAPPK